VGLGFGATEDAGVVGTGEFDEPTEFIELMDKPIEPMELLK
jgi:hypothetical protein